ncbi:MAG: hypothetical protein KDB35_23875, partial [Acidimicrobiales bacterium]|nr:hypothetical protein [Acidimicrobiales bacterium]
MHPEVPATGTVVEPGQPRRYAPGVHEIRAEIPANVWQVVVDEGQLVAEGDEIVILESMK